MTITIDELMRIYNDYNIDNLLTEDAWRPPEIEIQVVKDRSYADCGVPIGLTYHILHKSGWCNVNTNISIFFDKSDEYIIELKNKKLYNNSERINLSLSPLVITPYSINVTYNNPGKHTIPILDIDGATTYQGDYEIEVMPNKYERILQGYGALISLLIALITIIFTCIELRKQQTEIRNTEIEIRTIEIELNQIIQNKLTIETKKKEPNPYEPFWWEHQ